MQRPDLIIATETTSVAEDLLGPPAGIATQRRRLAKFGLILAIAWLVLLIGSAVFVNVLPFQNPKALNPGFRATGPSWSHWLGTDQLARDQLSRLAHGARTSLIVGFSSAFLAGFFGSLVGLIAGFYGSVTETLAMGWMDIMLAVPALVLAIVLTSLMGPGVLNVVLAISILSIPAFARLSRAQTLVYKERDFVKAARALGSKNRSILFREIVPNIAPPLFAYVLITIATAIVIEGALSFIGVGADPDEPSWGGMINAGRGELDVSPHISLIPAFAMFLTVLSLNRLGEHVEGRSGATKGTNR